MMSRRAAIGLGLVSCFLATTASHPAARPADPGADLDARVSAEVFEQFKRLAGDWHSRSTRGWTGEMRIRIIAAGSVVLATSEFDDSAASDRGMATLIARDGKRLVLTHFCEARNQPRLVLSSRSPDGNTVGFVFLDGGNLPSRDVGHMDSVVFHFVDADHFRTRWTWYEKGRERWLEEIERERIRTGPTGTGARGSGDR